VQSTETDHLEEPNQTLTGDSAPRGTGVAARPLDLAETVNLFELDRALAGFAETVACDTYSYTIHTDTDK